MLFQPDLLLLIFVTPRLLSPGFELPGLCFPMLTLMSQCNILISPCPTKYFPWITENMKNSCRLRWYEHEVGVTAQGRAEELHHHWEHLFAGIWTQNMGFGPGFPVRSKLQSSSAGASTDGGAASASPVLLQHLPSSPALARQGKEEKIAAQMFSKSVSTAASALADRQTCLSLITVLCSIFWDIQQNPFSWLGPFSD